MRKPRSYGEVYNDLDGEIVNLFRVLRSERSNDLIRALSLTPFSRADFEESYVPTDDALEQARRTVVRSFMGFGSGAASGNKTGFRANSNRSGTTPAHDWANFPPALATVAQRLAGVVIESKDAAEIIWQHDSPETLHYVDPPYPIGTRKMGNPYCGKGYRFELTDDQHRELSGELRGVRGMVVLSGYACDLYDKELYADWHRVTKATHADGARDRVEVLWLNNAAWRMLALTGTLDLGGAA
jgi:DNA adenine methylase